MRNWWGHQLETRLRTEALLSEAELQRFEINSRTLTYLERHREALGLETKQGATA